MAHNLTIEETLIRLIDLESHVFKMIMILLSIILNIGRSSLNQFEIL